MECPGLVSQLCISVSHGIVCPGEIDNHIGSVTPACDVQLVVDDSIRKAACRVREWGGCGEIRPGVRRGIVLPRVGLSARNTSSVIAANDINLTSRRDVAASRKTVHIRHVRASSPCVGCDIVDPSDVIVNARYRIVTAEHVNLVRRWIIDCCGGTRRLRHRCHRRPSICSRIEPIDYRQGVALTKGVSPKLVAIRAIGSARCCVQVEGH